MVEYMKDEEEANEEKVGKDGENEDLEKKEKKEKKGKDKEYFLLITVYSQYLTISVGLIRKYSTSSTTSLLVFTVIVLSICLVSVCLSVYFSF